MTMITMMVVVVIMMMMMTMTCEVYGGELTSDDSLEKDAQADYDDTESSESSSSKNHTII